MTDRIEAMKTLLTRMIDSREGYGEAREHVTSDSIKSLFDDFIARRDRNAAELRGYLAREGHSVPEDGSLLAAAHRAFMDLKDKVSDDDAAVLQEVLRGEKTLLDAYDTAITEAGGADPEYQFLVTQHDELQAEIARLDTRHDIAA